MVILWEGGVVILWDGGDDNLQVDGGDDNLQVDDGIVTVS